MVVGIRDKTTTTRRMMTRTRIKITTITKKIRIIIINK